MTNADSRQSSNLVGRQRRRLRWAFRAALAAVSGPAALLACASNDSASRSGDGADSAAATDALSTADAGDRGALRDAGLDCSSLQGLGCNSLLYADARYVGDGSDAEICPVLLPCGLPSTVKTAGCTVVDSVSGLSIGCWIASGCTADVFQPGVCGSVGLECYCDMFSGGGRRLSGSLRSGRIRARDALGYYFARMAEEEAASVHAFAVLARELSTLGAPEELVLAAERARKDEVRHARTLSRLAAGRGVRPSPGRRGRRAWSAEALALENAVEGCVRETYGALLVTWQSAHAMDSIIRRLLERVAADETRHAALAWAIAAWLEPTLEAGARRRVERARRRAVRTLSKQLARPVPEALVHSAGFPRPFEGHALLAALARSTRRLARLRSVEPLIHFPRGAAQRSFRHSRRRSVRSGGGVAPLQSGSASDRRRTRASGRRPRATHERNGWSFDLGGHRFVSADEALSAWLEQLLGDDLLERERRSVVLHEGRRFRYPLGVRDLLANLGLRENARALIGYAAARARAHAPRALSWPRATERSSEDTFEGWVCARFGRPLYDTLLRALHGEAVGTSPEAPSRPTGRASAYRCSI